MIKVWCKFEQNRTKAIKIIEKKNPNVDGMMEFQNDRHAESSIPLKLYFAGGIKY